MQYFLNKNLNQHLFVVRHLEAYGFHFFNLKENKLHSDYINFSEIDRVIDRLIEKGFAQQELKKIVVESVFPSSEKIAIEEKFYFHLDNQLPALRQPLVTVKLSKNDISEGGYRLFKYIEGNLDRKASFANLASYLSRNTIYYGNTLHDYQVVPELENVLTILNALGFKRIDEKSILEKVLRKPLIEIC